MRFKCIKSFVIVRAKNYIAVEEGSLWKLTSGGGGKVTLQKCNDGLVTIETSFDALKKYFERVIE